MRMHTRGCQMMVTEASKTTNFWGHFFCNMSLYWLKSHSSLHFPIDKFVSGGLKQTTKQPPTLLAQFFYNTICDCLSENWPSSDLPVFQELLN